jgi:hypothetical protein
MEPVTVIAIGVFLAPFLQKAGEKLVEKSVELAFDSRRDLLESFSTLFREEIITLGLNNALTEDDVEQQLAVNPEIRKNIDVKIANNQDLLSEFVSVLRQTSPEKFANVTINAEKIAQINYSQNVSQHIENF